MKYIDLTLSSPAENLACDETLLDLCDEGLQGEILRFWESPKHFVVLGYANSAAKEVNLATCESENVPVLRRLSGGGTVLQGPGSLNYSLILKIPQSGPLATITGANRFIMQKQRDAIQPLVKGGVAIEGHTDLALGNLKFSGNAQRRKRNALIFHGTILLNFGLALIEKYLWMPSKQPEYRSNRSHKEFLMNLGVAAEVVKQAIRNEWQAGEQFTDVPTAQINSLSVGKYSTDSWNLRS
jgi:lipoate---protein ligase